MVEPLHVGSFPYQAGRARISDTVSEKKSENTWEGLLPRLRGGDVTARNDMLTLAHERLRRLAGKMLHTSFPALRQRHDLDSVVNEGCLRLLRAFDSGVIPETLEDFFRFAAFKVRQVLLDMADGSAKLAARVQATGDSGETPEPAQETFDPAALALWREFHDRADSLEEPERTVFGLKHYLGLSQAEIGETLSMHPRTVSRVWIRATERLADVFPGGGGT